MKKLIAPPHVNASRGGISIRNITYDSAIVVTGRRPSSKMTNLEFRFEVFPGDEFHAPEYSVWNKTDRKVWVSRVHVERANEMLKSKYDHVRSAGDILRIIQPGRQASMQPGLRPQKREETMFPDFNELGKKIASGLLELRRENRKRLRAEIASRILAATLASQGQLEHEDYSCSVSVADKLLKELKATEPEKDEA